MLLFSMGCCSCGAIDASGCSTNRRLCISGCGMVSFGLFIMLFPYRRISMSIGRSLYSPSMLFVVRPNVRSISCVAASSSCGDKIVSKAATVFRNRFSDWNPQGLVSIVGAMARGLPNMRDRSSIAHIRFCSLLPRFVPRLRYMVSFSIFVSR